MEHDKNKINEIANDVEAEYKMSGLASGIYLDFAIDVAIRYADKLNETQLDSLVPVVNRFNSKTFIDNVCLSYRHDFGLMGEQDKELLRFECIQWMRAISNNWQYFKKEPLT